MSATLPIVDIRPFRLREEGAAQVIDAIRTAAEETGFFLVTGHGVDAAVTERLYTAARQFFDLQEEERLKVPSVGETVGGITYAPLRSEALAATQGEATPGDLKHSLNFGTRLGGGDWPASPPGLEAAFRAYFKEMEQLSATMRAIFCAAIGLPEGYFDADFAEHLSALRVIDYPEQATAPVAGQLRAGAHTDYGFMTILRSEASPGGLQVQGRDGAWVDVPAIDGAYVINIADAFMRWTNDRWVSTPHRVVNPPVAHDGPTRRQSIPFFVNPAHDSLIRCLPPFEGDGARHEPITFGEYIALKTRQAFGPANG